MVSIITGVTHKPASSQQLECFFANHKDWEGYLYIGYPVIGTVDGAYHIDAVYLSKEKGLVIFNLVENDNLEDYQDEQDDSYNKIEAKLKSYRDLMYRRNLCVKISVITFAPCIREIASICEYPVCNEKNLESCLDSIQWDNPEYFEKLVAVLQSVSTIRRSRRKRSTQQENSKGTKLKFLEDSIANLDSQQSKAVIETVKGVQRIRGLAGSGKTIVLALKAAYLHAQHPEWKIAVTFHTRALKGQFRQLINTFTIEQTGEEPDWDNLQILHAWGAPGGEYQNGIYYTFCTMQGIEYYDYMGAKKMYADNTFGRICEKALGEMTESCAVYDALLVDEAQDFSPFFLKICYELLKEPKQLVYAYDELQNLSSQSLPSPEEIFGKDETGNDRVSFSYDEEGKSKQDIILDKCYRNSRPALVTAHALGFGVYREKGSSSTGIVQMFENKELWEEIGYKISNGQLGDGERVVLERTGKSSPEFLENHSACDDLVMFKVFESAQEQDEWVAAEIQKNIQQDELRRDDIIVINPNPLTTRKRVAPIRNLLYEKGISSHVSGVDTSPDIFFTNESVVFTGIYRAKGNEAAMVYVINAQDCYTSEKENEIAAVRNRLFTAITRSKAWVRVLGFGSGMEKLMQEFEEVKKHNFKLDFIYPTQEERKRMNIVNRDMSNTQRNVLKRRQNSVSDLIKGFEEGQLYLEDFDDEQIAKLRDLLVKDRINE